MNEGAGFRIENIYRISQGSDGEDECCDSKIDSILNRHQKLRKINQRLFSVVL